MTRMRVAVAVVGGLIIVVGGLAWWFGFFSDAPEEVTIGAAVEAVGDEDAEADEDAGTESDNGTGTEAATEPAPADGITGTWTVQPDEDVTFVGYRINEVLTTIGDFEVVGRTPDVSGTMEAEGSTITAVSLVAQMDTLTTDSDRRDQAMRTQALETSEFPEAAFELSSPIELGAMPAEGEPVSVAATGELTIHGVTQTVDFALDAQLVDDLIVVVGQLQVLLADFGVEAPRAPVVASVEDTATLELSVAFSRS